MATDLVWQFTPNYDYPLATSQANAGKSFLWLVVEMLTGGLARVDASNVAVVTPHALWTVVGSSDGVTAGMDGVNRWHNGGVFDATKFVHSTGVHSWVVLRSPAVLGDIWLTLDCAQNTIGFFNLHLSSAAPTGGTTATSPAQTGNIVFTNDSVANGTTARRFYGMVAANGEFIFLGAIAASAVFCDAFFVKKGENAMPEDPFPFLVFHDVTAAGVMRSNGQLISGLNRMFSKTAAGASTAACVMEYRSGSGGSTGYLTGVTTDPFNGKMVDLPAFASTYNTWTWKGKLVDFKLTQASGADGLLSPTTGAPEWMKVGMVWLPCCGVGPNL